MNKKNFHKAVVFVILSFFVSVGKVYALTDPSGLVQSGATVSGFFVNLATIIYALIGIGFFAVVMFAGFTWMTASGNPEKIKKAVLKIIT